METQFYNAAEVARMLGVDRSTVTRWLQADRFPNAITINPTSNKPVKLIPVSDYEAVKAEIERAE